MRTKKKQRKAPELGVVGVNPELKPGETRWSFRSESLKSTCEVVDLTWYSANARALVLLGAEPGSLTFVALEGLHKK